MAIIRFDPFKRSLFSYPDQAFETFFDEDESWPELTMTQGLNIYEEDDKVVVKAAVPGIPEDKLNITYEDGVLHIQGRSEETEEEKKKKKVVYKKHMVSSVDYTSYLPRAVETGKISAEVKDGIVTITAPIAETAKPKRIPVKVSSKK